MKIMFIVLLSSVLIFGQIISTPVDSSDVVIVAVDTTISAEELFLQDIAKKALEKEANKQKLTNNLLVIAIIILLIDKFK